MFPKVVMCLRYAVCSANVCNYFELRKNHAKKVLRYTFYVTGSTITFWVVSFFCRAQAKRKTYNVKRKTYPYLS